MVNAIAMGLLSIVLLIAAVTDMRTGKIFNWITYPAMLAGLTFWSVAGVLHLRGAPASFSAGMTQSVAALLAGLVPFAVCMTLGGLGGGDVKLMGAVGALSARWECVLDTAVYAIIISCLLAIITMIRHRIVLRTLRRILGALLAAAARVKTDLPTDSPRVPFALAVCLGGLLAGAEHLMNVKLPWSTW